ncbi:MAG TPA: helix-turn-helix domain-containing protein, partial [Spirochaetota bacterium]|nr:helix-turn-helix domain-containing protein [Spirochaetota bacterium]HPP49118.1 helix-turn-helix domain-containing protein [Spirochaetota bacterium]
SEAMKARYERSRIKGLDILSIGVAVGFNSNTTFCTVFSKMTGMSPKQYRKEYGKK